MFVELLKDFLGHKAGTRIDVDAKQGEALVQSGTAKAVEDAALGALVSQTLGDAIGRLTQGIETAVDTALKAFATKLTHSRKNAVPAIFGHAGEGDPKKTFGAFLIAIRGKDVKALEEMGSQFVEWGGDVDKKATLGTQTGTAGGYTVPTEFYERIMAPVIERSFWRQRATIIPMSARITQVPSIDSSTPPAAGDTATLGGLVCRWTEEGATLNQTEPNFRQVELKNYELSGYSKIQNSLLADNAVGLEAFLYQLFSRAISWYEEYSFLRGNGVGKPLGAIAWPGLITVARSGGANTFTITDYANMIGRWLPNFDPSASCWVIHPTLWPRLLNMNAAGTGSNLVYIDNVRERPQMMLAGLPLFVSEKLPGLNSIGDILLADVSQYLIGDRQQIEIAFSEHVAFLNNQTVWRFVSRVGGMPWMKDKLTLADATNTLSPFVAVDAG